MALATGTRSHKDVTPRMYRRCSQLYRQSHEAIERRSTISLCSEVDSTADIFCRVRNGSRRLTLRAALSSARPFCSNQRSDDRSARVLFGFEFGLVWGWYVLRIPKYFGLVWGWYVLRIPKCSGWYTPSAGKYQGGYHQG